MRALDRGAARVATALIATGPVRDRYLDEFTAELDDLSGARRSMRMFSLMLGAPGLHRALVETGVLTFPHSSWWCRARLHHRWAVARTDDGSEFKRCRDCGIDNDETYMTPASDVAGAILRGPPT